MAQPGAMALAPTARTLALATDLAAPARAFGDLIQHRVTSCSDSQPAQLAASAVTGLVASGGEAAADTGAHEDGGEAASGSTLEALACATNKLVGTAVNVEAIGNDPTYAEMLARELELRDSWAGRPRPLSSSSTSNRLRWRAPTPAFVDDVPVQALSRR